MGWKNLQSIANMKVKPLTKKQKKLVDKLNLQAKYNKAAALFEVDYRHLSLHIELLEPKHLKIYSFRIDIKYRAVFLIVNGEAEVIAITNHYK